MQTIVNPQNLTPTKLRVRQLFFRRFVCLALGEKFIQEMFKCLNVLETRDKFIQKPKRVHDVCFLCQINI